MDLVVAIRKNWDNSIFVGLILNVLLRWSVSRFPYSGFRKPPMYGDYEAQRHWQEITYNLAPDEWYRHTEKNDLQYWGLDYPPLTAYHSLINGWVAAQINESWVALNSSRGIETYHHKIFMRSSVLVVDLLIYFTGFMLFWLTSKDNMTARARSMCITLCLMYPGLILIDHGHFQYNCVSLGLTIWAIFMLMNQEHFYGSMLFSLALNYKQMSLYHSFPFFSYLLAICLQQKGHINRLGKLCEVSIAVVLTFIICWIPFLTSPGGAMAVLQRIFPFYRGLYEDKVANVWCSLEILIKLKQLLEKNQLVTISAVSTFVCLLPSNIHLFRNPSIHNFKLSLINSSLVFFLLSYQVHEKSILLVSAVAMLLMSRHPLTTLWFFAISTFSLQPLLTKDGLILPYYAVMAFFLIIYSAFYKDMQLSHNENVRSKTRTVCFVASLMGALCLSLCSVLLKPPKRYPDIFAVANAIYSCAHFICFSLYYHYLQLFAREPVYTKLKSN